MQPRDQAALDLYQATKSKPRAVAEGLLDEFFGLTEFKRQMACVEVEFPTCVISRIDTKASSF